MVPGSAATALPEQIQGSAKALVKRFPELKATLPTGGAIGGRPKTNV